MNLKLIGYGELLAKKAHKLYGIAQWSCELITTGPIMQVMG